MTQPPISSIFRFESGIRDAIFDSCTSGLDFRRRGHPSASSLVVTSLAEFVIPFGTA